MIIQEFDPEFIQSKSQAAAGLSSWVLNVMVFHYINENVKPLRQALAQANAELKAALDKLTALRARLAVHFYQRRKKLIPQFFASNSYAPVKIT